MAAFLRVDAWLIVTAQDHTDFCMKIQQWFGTSGIPAHEAGVRTWW